MIKELGFSWRRRRIWGELSLGEEVRKRRGNLQLIRIYSFGIIVKGLVFWWKGRALLQKCEVRCPLLDTWLAVVERESEWG